MGSTFKNSLDNQFFQITCSSFSLYRDIFASTYMKITYEEFLNNRKNNYLKMEETLLSFWFKKSDIKGEFSETEIYKILEFYIKNKKQIYETLGVDENIDVLLKPFISYIQGHQSNEVYYS